MRFHHACLSSVAFAACALVGCSSSGHDESTITLRFGAKVGAQPFACGTTYTGIGTSGSTIQPIEFQMYISQISLVRASGDMVPFTIADDGKWQGQGVALLDFADGTGMCPGTPDINSQIVGSAPDHDDYRGIQFAVGVPEALDHLNAPVAKAPLNQPGLWWSWTAGYKFMKLEINTTGNTDWYAHIGASDCSGLPDAYDCKYINQPQVTMLSGFDPSTNTIVADVAALYANTNVDAQPNYTTEPEAGCMSEDNNDFCPPVFASLGMMMDHNAPLTTQTFFHVE